MSEELKVCCGSRPQASTYIADANLTLSIVNCIICKKSSGRFYTEKDAIKAWNTRQEPSDERRAQDMSEL